MTLSRITKTNRGSLRDGDGLKIKATEINAIIDQVNTNTTDIDTVETSGALGKLATATATAAGLTTGALTDTNQFVTVTSGGANDVICLPLNSTCPIGTVIKGWVGANGCELRVHATDAATVTVNGITTNVEAAIPATTLFTVQKVTSTGWLLTAVDELGAVITAIIPDAI